MISVEVGIFIYFSFQNSGCRIEGNEGLEFLFPEMIKYFVGRYPVKPGVKSCVASESRQCGPYLDEDVLKKVICIFV